MYVQNYNAENRLSAIHKMDGTDCDSQGEIVESWLFVYDGDGTRVRTVVMENGNIAETTYYFGGVEMRVTGEATMTKTYYSLAGQLVGMRTVTGTESTLNYFLTDHPSASLRTSLGSVSAILGSTGALVREQRYKPYGEVRGDLGVPVITQTDMGYTGQRAVSGTGLMDYRARFYDPLLYRFVQPDTIVPSAGDPQSWNRYSYTLNSPINFKDPSGHMVWEDGGASSMGNAYWKHHELVISLLGGEYRPEDDPLGIEMRELVEETATENGFCLPGDCAKYRGAPAPIKPSDPKTLYPHVVFDGIEVDWNQVDIFEAVLDVAGILGDIALVAYPEGPGEVVDGLITLVEVTSILKAGEEATNGDIRSMNFEVLSYTMENNPILIARMGRWVPLLGSILSGISLYDNFINSGAVTINNRTEYP